MKSILMSIKPKWVEKIASGEKTVEVRKSVPKCGTPFKVYMYCTYGRPLLMRSFYDGKSLFKFSGVSNKDAKVIYDEELWNGKVVGEFVCDKIIEAPTSFISPDTVNIAICSRLTEKDLVEYGKCKTIYGLHISDLKIYDKPRELDEFIAGEKKHCVSYFGGNCARSTTADVIRCKNLICERKEITRPPQSWVYVEEL